MNKDELKKIYSAHLPYGLTGELKYDITEDFQDEDWVQDLSIFKKGAIWKLAGYADHDLNIPMGEGEFSGWLWRNGNTYAGIDEAVKPILYDLSYLTKEIEHEGETFVPFNILSPKIRHEIEFSKLPAIGDFKVKDYQKLLELHFNVFGLPEGQFINKATLTNK